MKKLIFTTKRVVAIIVCCLCVTTAYTQEYCSQEFNGRFFPCTSDCQKYFQCAGGHLISRKCMNGLLFNPELLCCDLAQNVHCADWGFLDTLGNFFSGYGLSKNEYSVVKDCTKTENSGGFSFGVSVTIPNTSIGVSGTYTTPSSSTSYPGKIKICYSGGLENCDGYGCR